MRLILFPGLGADARMFADLRCPGVDVITPSLPEPRSRQTLASYARTLTDRLRIDAGTAVGGASFGGFVASEIAAQRRVAALVLIGSALSPREIPSYYAVLERLSRVVPVGLFDRAPRHHPLVLAPFGRLAVGQRALFVDMASKVSPLLLRRGLRMIFGWKGVRREALGCPLHRIHGRIDRLIRPPLTRDVEWVAGGGHLIAMTHSAAVSRFLQKALPR